jgi:hypothetical protein
MRNLERHVLSEHLAHHVECARRAVAPADEKLMLVARVHRLANTPMRGPKSSLPGMKRLELT